jgi:hypothetical protein
VVSWQAVVEQASILLPFAVQPVAPLLWLLLLVFQLLLLLLELLHVLLG